MHRHDWDNDLIILQLSAMLNNNNLQDCITLILIMLICKKAIKNQALQIGQDYFFH